MPRARKLPSELVQSSRARAINIATVVARVERCEAWLCAGMPPRRVQRQAEKPEPEGLGLTRMTAGRYVAAAIERLQSDNMLEPIESKRARIVAMVHSQIEGALSHVRAFEQDGKVITYACPDRKAAIAATKLLAELELGTRPTP